MNKFHKPVLLSKTIDLLQIKPGKKYIDATLGGGGHAERVLNLGGKVLGIDVDQEAIDYVSQNINNKNLVLVKGNFSQIGEIARLNGFEKVFGILFDLGVSSHQIDSTKRGFSFLKNGPLDMRMDKDSILTAEYLVNVLGKGELYELFNRLGQESHASAISRAITGARRVKAIQTTNELLDVIAKAYGYTESLSDFDKNKIGQKVFQALRIAVNNELENIEIALPQAVTLLESTGRIAVISFHSLEDRIVKKTFKEFQDKDLGRIITQKPVVPDEKEIRKNSRSKSSKLRIFEKN
ncbi:MAG: 16S rRNA (cytosine(1402)-N(4))-methyltransferase RsmH [Candidatus Levybacteria bacterium]|nr:16S rRNA (cytosine(1402)-N(4))-methyltransferase RsmH [Candidatus Levybacteria bacterium]